MRSRWRQLHARGDVHMWALISDENRHVVGHNPDLIDPGQRRMISASDSQAEPARQPLDCRDYVPNEPP